MNGIISAWQACNEAFPDHSVAVQGGHQAFKKLLAACIATRPAEGMQCLVVVCPTSKEVDAFASELRAFFSEVALNVISFPGVGLWGRDRYVNPLEDSMSRSACLAMISADHVPTVVVSCPEALAKKTVARDVFDAARTTVTVGSILDIDDLCERLHSCGYREASHVIEPGSYCFRGGIFDVFACGAAQPARIELMGDRVLSLREFDASSQRSLQTIAQLDISIAGECFFESDRKSAIGQAIYDELMSNDVAKYQRDGMMRSFYETFRFSGYTMFQPLYCRQETIWSYLAQKKTGIYFLEARERVLEGFRETYEEYEARYREDLAAGHPCLSVDQHYAAPDELERILREYWCLDFVGAFHSEPDLIVPTSHFDLPQFALADTIAGRITQLEKLSDAGAKCIVTVLDEKEEQRFSELLSLRGVAFHCVESMLEDFLDHHSVSVAVGPGHIEAPFFDGESHTLFLKASDVLPRLTSAAAPSTRDLEKLLDSFSTISIRDFIVHVEHGIGRYLGIKSLTAGGSTGDFLEVEYAQGDRLFVPVDRISCLQKYVGDGAGSSMDRLGHGTWTAKKAKVRRQVEDIAVQLLKTQAQRTRSSIGRYGPPSQDFLDFVAACPFVETADQLKAIEEVEADFMAPACMDRLLVGDVGYGKTEVAMRAAMRAVLEGFQVMILVPTTVLAYQHTRSFGQRMQSYGLEIASVSRLVPSAERKRVLMRFAEGQVDILIGTHRLFSKDVIAKNLGLLIVDEEQKFGVVHKERIKELRTNVDILAMTATPIPRTLHMAMSGLRDISLIASPPKNRKPVATIVSHFEKSIVRESIANELSRGGQVFYIHNRVSDIEEKASMVRELVPGASVRVGHGQMTEAAIEKVIVDFINGKFQVLVCTTIIESGVDMPNVNTLIVSNAENFGLSQLYQLRGRVGRSITQAYAVLLVGSGKKLSDDAQRRLEAIVAHQALGSGFRIASTDLEIRGAGNLLGREQSGHASVVGLEAYAKMLADEVAVLSGKSEPQLPDPEIKLSVSALIPPEFVPSERDRLILYKQLFQASSIDEVDALSANLVDRFGSLPDMATRLLIVAEVKVLLRCLRADCIVEHVGGGSIEIRFAAMSENQIQRLTTYVDTHCQVFSLTPDFRLIVRCNVAKTTDNQTDWLKSISGQLMLLLEDIGDRS